MSLTAHQLDFQLPWRFRMTRAVSSVPGARGAGAAIGIIPERRSGHDGYETNLNNNHTTCMFDRTGSLRMSRCFAIVQVGDCARGADAVAMLTWKLKCSHQHAVISAGTPC